MEFEFDGAKSEANAARHGIDFVVAQALWLDECLIEIPAKTVDEPRSLVIGVRKANTIRRSSRTTGAASGSSRYGVLGRGRWRSIKASEFDKKFDEGVADVVDDLDLSQATRANQPSRRVNVDFPSWMVDSLDREAKRLGVTRQSVIKVWIAERLGYKAS